MHLNSQIPVWSHFFEHEHMHLVIGAVASYYQRGMDTISNESFKNIILHFECLHCLDKIFILVSKILNVK